jgi:hypothetical protein
VSKMTYGNPQAHVKEEQICEPHKVWIQFLHERFQSDRYKDLDYLTLYSHFFITTSIQNIPMKYCSVT